MDTEVYEFDAEVWPWRSANGGTTWFFLTLPVDVSADLRMEAGPPRGFGSVRVEATIGDSTWRTSVFPQAESGCFLLPVKKPIRNAEGLDDGVECAVRLRLAE
jgi:hypothetical protein